MAGLGGLVKRNQSFMIRDILQETTGGTDNGGHVIKNNTRGQSLEFGSGQHGALPTGPCVLTPGHCPPDLGPCHPSSGPCLPVPCLPGPGPCLPGPGPCPFSPPFPRPSFPWTAYDPLAPCPLAVPFFPCIEARRQDEALLLSIPYLELATRGMRPYHTTVPGGRGPAAPRSPRPGAYPRCLAGLVPGEGVRGTVPGRTCLTGGCCEGCPPTDIGVPVRHAQYGRYLEGVPSNVGGSADNIPVPIPIPVYVRTRASPSSDGNTRPKKCRRSRTVFAELQLMGLERRFTDQKYLSTPDRADLARALGLSQVQVKTWYQNRRMKWKKQVLQDGATEAPTKAKGRPRKQTTVLEDHREDAGTLDPQSDDDVISDCDVMPQFTDTNDNQRDRDRKGELFTS